MPERAVPDTTAGGHPPHLASDEPRALADDRVLEVSDLGVRAGDRTILHGVSFEVIRGTTLAVVGPNGAGKTVLLRTLLGLVRHTGTITWRGDVQIGYVPQTFAVTDVPITVREFLAIKRRTDFRECLAYVGLDHEAILDHRLGTLSGGELQRVLIAWAIVDRPNILLFDEPTSNIDLGGEDLVLETLNRIEKELGMTVLLVSHDIHNVIAYSDAVLALNRTVTYFGESKNLSDPTLLARIYGSSTLLARHRHEGGDSDR